MIYRGCEIIKKEQGFLIITPTHKFILIKDAQRLEDCQLWIDRQLARLAVGKALGDF